jgi:hypothetical protein
MLPLLYLRPLYFPHITCFLLPKCILTNYTRINMKLYVQTIKYVFVNLSSCLSQILAPCLVTDTETEQAPILEINTIISSEGLCRAELPVMSG